jgi:hypothetical protein
MFRGQCGTNDRFIGYDLGWYHNTLNGALAVVMAVLPWVMWIGSVILQICKKPGLFLYQNNIDTIPSCVKFFTPLIVGIGYCRSCVVVT